MSRLVIKSVDGSFTMNVVQFRSPMNAEITSVQTKAMQQHFPIRCGQPEIEFTCQFASLDERDRFQTFVRRHQILSQTNPDLYQVTLWWPERDIINWTGYLTLLPVSEKKFEWAPSVTFGVMLVNSMMSQKTTESSHGAAFSAIYGPQIAPDLSLIRYAVDGLIQPPTVPSSQTQSPPAPRPVTPAVPTSVLPGVGR